GSRAGGAARREGRSATATASANGAPTRQARASPATKKFPAATAAASTSTRRRRVRSMPALLSHDRGAASMRGPVALQGRTRERTALHAPARALRALPHRARLDGAGRRRRGDGGARRRHGPPARLDRHRGEPAREPSFRADRPPDPPRVRRAQHHDRRHRAARRRGVAERGAPGRAGGDARGPPPPDVIAPNVVSLAAPSVRHAEEEGGTIRVDYLMRDVPETPEEIAALRARLEDDPALRGMLVTPDQRAALVMLDFYDGTSGQDVFARTLSLAEPYRDRPLDFYFAGEPMFVM